MSNITDPTLKVTLFGIEFELSSNLDQNYQILKKIETLRHIQEIVQSNNCDQIKFNTLLEFCSGHYISGVTSGGDLYDRGFTFGQISDGIIYPLHSRDKIIDSPYPLATDWLPYWLNITNFIDFHDLAAVPAFTLTSGQDKDCYRIISSEKSKESIDSEYRVAKNEEGLTCVCLDSYDSLGSFKHLRIPFIRE